MALFPFSLAMDWRFQSANLVPLLPTFLVRTENGWAHFYGGISIGPMLMTANVEDLKTKEGKTASRVYLMGFARGGIDFDVAKNVGVSFEPLRIGYVDNEWLFNPELAVSVAF
jgi:hypothetical protein